MSEQNKMLNLDTKLTFLNTGVRVKGPSKDIGLEHSQTLYV